MKNLDRYQRQIILNRFGLKSQLRLLEAKVLVVGAGGLGNSVLQCLNGVGVGCIGIIDFDKVEIVNLHRQFLFDETNVGQLKVEVAKNKLLSQNGGTNIDVYPVYFSNKNALDIIKHYDIVVDCSDNFTTRYVINDACFLLQKPWVYAAIFEYEGHVSLFNNTKTQKEKTTYRDLFPYAPDPSLVPNCNENGVLGSLVNILGNFQATEVIKFITKIDETLTNKMLIFNLLTYQISFFEYEKNVINTLPKNEQDFLNRNYSVDCHNHYSIHTLDSLNKILNKAKSVLIDVREIGEMPVITKVIHKKIPLKTLVNNLEQLEEWENIIFVCQSGVRSFKALLSTIKKYPHKKIYHITKGVKLIVK